MLHWHACEDQDECSELFSFLPVKKPKANQQLNAISSNYNIQANNLYSATYTVGYTEQCIDLLRTVKSD